MKPAIRHLITLTALAAAAHASPFLSAGDGAELILSAKAGISHDDNILLGSAKLDDVVYELTPSARLVIGDKESPLARLEASARRLQFGDAKPLDRWDSSVRASVDHGDDESTKLHFDAAYAQLSDNTFDLRPVDGAPLTRSSLLRRNELSLGGTADFRYSDLSTFFVGIDHDTLKYRDAVGVDRRVLEPSVAHFFRVAPKSDLGLGFRYRDTDVDGVGAGVRDSRDYYANVALRGQLTSDLSGHVSTGYLWRKVASGPNLSTLGAEAALVYKYFEYTRLIGAVSNDFATAPNGLARRDLRTSLGLSTQITDGWSLSLKTGYTRAKYLGRQDGAAPLTEAQSRAAGLYSEDWIEGGLTVGYALNTHLAFEAGYLRRQLVADDQVGEFDANLFSFSVTLSY